MWPRGASCAIGLIGLAGLIKEVVKLLLLFHGAALC